MQNGLRICGSEAARGVVTERIFHHDFIIETMAKIVAIHISKCVINECILNEFFVHKQQK